MNTLYVESVEGMDTVEAGSFDRPLATIQGAFDRCRGGEIVLVSSKHVEEIWHDWKLKAEEVSLIGMMREELGGHQGECQRCKQELPPSYSVRPRLRIMCDGISTPEGLKRMHNMQIDNVT